MASIFELIRWCKAVINKAEAFQPGYPWPLWKKQDICDHLSELSPAKFEDFYQAQQQHAYTDPFILYPAYGSTERCLRAVCYGVEDLQRQTCTKEETARFAAFACRKIISALYAFHVVKSDSKLKTPRMWTYLEKVYRAALIIGALSLPPRTESQFSCSEDFLADIKLYNFSFETDEANTQVQHTTSEAVIASAERVPECYLPELSDCTPPMMVYAHGPYGRLLVGNAYATTSFGFGY